ncbi:MAG: hypothetical protein R6T78_03160 [Dehalococcoidales bacterium]
MKSREEITECAREYFDVAGIYNVHDGKSTLILGLETRPERNLDEFGKTDRGIELPGFAKYVQPGLDQVVKNLEKLGIAASILGKYGYAHRGEADFFNYKTAAIKAGLGKRGKNTLVINPVFGSRLRFAALRLNTILETGPDESDEESPLCRGCSICIDECPLSILKPYRLIDTAECLSNIVGDVAEVEDNRFVLCDICLQRCPANSIGLD